MSMVFQQMMCNNCHQDSWQQSKNTNKDCPRCGAKGTLVGTNNFRVAAEAPKR